MSKQIQVNLAFNADTTKAKQQINDLVNSLNKIATKDSQIFDDRQLREAATAAKDLTKHLEAAVNVNTGKLDLNKFSQSLSQSKQNLQDLYNSLSKAGPAGQQAFLKLASSIASSESRVLNLNAKVKDLGVTLKNTVKWQLSSSLIHGFMGALQHAIGYAKDLNSSLNDIRIVTGSSVNEMARFAEQANKAAKSLSATTTEYTKASLIYYQQGLSEEQVKERTDITIKMANVSRQSAEIVSEQMTAVWNNFADGTKSLEYYADVMTALGAATASSVDEIAGGLEKFAAIGDTIGLSYEYAASALATITSNTRQSEEVVGTALKTIFARIQGLNLGETLDDGTTLNKYSQALQKVGISIFDQNGELKKMDTILDEMGNTWQALSKDQQTALAQTVAGTRQYTQLIALMDNWDKGDSDSFKSNLYTIADSEGALQEQQDIYSESWEAAADRVKAATEDIYDSLINDEAIIVLLNGLEKVLNLTGALIDGFGGLKGILLMVAGIFTRQMANEVPQALSKLKNNFEILTGTAQKKKEETIQSSIDIVQSRLDKGKFKTAGDTLRAKSTIEESRALLELEKNRSHLSEAQQQNIQKAIEERKASKDLQAALLDEIDVVKKKFAESKKQISTNQKEDKTTTIKSRIDDLQYLKGEKERALEIRQKKSSDITSQDEVFIKAYEKREQLRHLVDDSTDLMGGFNLNLNTTTVTQGIDILTEKLKNLYLQQEQYIQVTEEFQGQLNSFDYSIDFIQSTEDIKLQQQEIENLNNSMVNYAQRLKNIEGLGISAWDTDELTIKLSKCREVMETFGATSEEIAQEMNNIFKEWSSNTGTEVFQDLIGDSEKAEIQIGELDDTIQSVVNALQLLSPDKFKELAQEAEKTGQSLASLILEQQKANNMPTPSINTQPTMEFSTALTKVAGLGMDIMALFSSLGSAISVCFDEGATAGEKFIAVLSSIPAAAMSFAQITGALKDMPQALETVKNGFGKLKDFSVKGSGLAKVFENMGTAMEGTGFASTAMGKSIVGAFTGATTSVLSFWASLGLIALAIAAVVAVIALLVKGFKEWKASTPEGKLETAKNTTQSMAEAAKDADNAYQDLLSTINGYDSAINALEDMEARTQEFTNALIKANEEAWKLIDAYGLIQGIDWDYGENGEIIIKQESKDRITEEQNEKREDAIVAASASKIDEKQKAYDVAKNNAYGSLVYSVAEGNLTEDQQKKVYDVFGFSNGESKHLQERIKNATPEQEDEIVNELGAKYFGDQWDQDNAMQRQFIITAMSQMENIGKAYDAYKDLTTTEANERQKMISTSMSDEEAYQKSEYKGAIVNSLENKYDEEKAEQDKRYAGMSDKDVQNAFNQYLSDQGYIQEDGKVYKVKEDGTKGDEVVALSNLDAEGQRNVLAARDTATNLEAQGVEIAEKVNNITKNLGEEEKAVTKAAIDGDVSNLTEDQITKISGMSEDEIKKTYPAIEELANQLGLSIDEVIAKLKSGAKDWKPPEFNVEEWKKDYSDKMKIINDLETGDSISAEDYALLGEEYQQYFQVQADGTAILIGKAEELKAKAQEIEIEPIKKDIVDKQEKIDAVGMSTEEAKIAAENAQKSRTDYEKMKNYVEAVNQQYGKDFTATTEGFQQAIAFMEQQNQLLAEQQESIAATATSVEELNKLRQDGLITEQQYAEATKATVIKEAQAEGFDVKEIAEYAKWLQKTQKETVETEEEAYKLALAHKKLQRGVDKLAKNWDKLNKVMTSDNPEEIAKVLPEVNDALKDILNMSDKTFNQLSPDFAIKNWKLIQDVMNGVEGSYEKLVVAAGQDIALKINPELDGTEAYTQMTDFMNTLSNMATGTELKIEPKVENANALDSLVELLEAAGMFGEDIAAVLRGIGWEPKVEYEPLEIAAGATQESFGTQQVAVLQEDGSYKTETLDLAGAQKLSQEGKAFVPKIVSATKTGGSSKSYTPPSTNKGGGGGGGKSKPPEKKSSTSKSRYHTIQNQLEDLKSEYEDISEAAERAFGKDKLDAIDEQIKKNEELIASQEELLGTYGDVSLEGLDLDNFSNFENLKQNLDFDKAKMEAYFKDLMGTGITFEYDEKGNISNFRQIEDYMHAQYNKNTTALGEEDWEVFEKKYEKLEEYIEQYEETYDELRDAEQEYQDLLNKRLELELQKIQYAVELKLNVSEDDMAILEYQFDLLEDRAFASAKRITESTKQAENIYDQIQFNQQGLEETLALSGARIEDIFNGNIEGFTFTADQIDAIKEYRDNLLDLNTQLIEAQKQIEEQVIEAFNEFHDELDKGMEKFDHYNTMLESYRNIVDIVGKDVLKLDNGQIAKITSAQVDNSIRQLNAARDAYDTYRAAADDAKAKMDEYKAKVDNTNNKALKDSYQQDYEFWKQSYEEMDSSAREAQEELMDTWGSTLEAVVSQFEMAVEAAVETFNDAVYQLGGLEGLSNEFSIIKEKDDMLLDDYQKIYELSKLTRDINNSIDDTDNIGGKQKLKKLLQDINKLQEDGVEISQYDLEYLQKTYDLRLAELELEEAQRAKNTVRLSRDNEGNWSYIYTQNTDAVDAAQQKYEDALYAMQDLSSNYIDEMSEKLISTSQDMLAAISELRVEDFASQEDYYKEILRIEKMYKDQMAAQEIELNNAINNNKILYNTDWKNYSEATGYKISAAEDFATAFKDTLLGSLMDSEENTSTFAEFIGKATEQLTGELNQIAGTYYANIGNAMEAAGTKTGDFAEMLEENITAIQSESKKAAEAVADMAEQMDNDFIDIMDNVARWQEDYGREIDKIINKNELLINSFNDMIKALSGDMNEIDIRYNISSNTEAEEATGSGEVTVPKGTVSGATGMYTGNWNSKEGRVAVLHQKELLLNENDTSNFLTAIKITRAMLETIDLNARQASFGLGNLTPSSVKDEKTQTLEQAVHITAEFPNVSDHNEIEQAFTNLINTASQYANRK